MNTEFVYLIKIDPGENNNKFYRMETNNNGTFTATYGRINDGTPQKKTYNDSEWNRIYKSKIKKGYVDHTKLYIVVESTDTIETKDVNLKFTDEEVQYIIDFIRKQSRQNIQRFVKLDISSLNARHYEAGTQKLAEVTLALNNGLLEEANERLVELFAIIPRRIDRNLGVKQCLFTGDKEKDEQKLSDENDLLQQIDTTVTVNTQVFDELPYEISLEKNKSEIDAINEYFLRELDSYSRFNANGLRIKHVFKIVHNVTTNYKPAILGLSNIQLFWHGSRNSNWENILHKGLLIKPAGIPTAGSAFGNGIYGADLSRKSLGYTSLNGSYWANGSDNLAILALTEFEMGKTCVADVNYKGSFERFNSSKIKEIGYDSVSYLANRGGNIGFYNNEFIVYTKEQTNIRYVCLVERA